MKKFLVLSCAVVASLTVFFMAAMLCVKVIRVLFPERLKDNYVVTPLERKR